MSHDLKWCGKLVAINDSLQGVRSVTLTSNLVIFIVTDRWTNACNISLVGRFSLNPTKGQIKGSRIKKRQGSASFQMMLGLRSLVFTAVFTVLISETVESCSGESLYSCSYKGHVTHYSPIVENTWCRNAMKISQIIFYLTRWNWSMIFIASRRQHAMFEKVPISFEIDNARVNFGDIEVSSDWVFISITYSQLKVDASSCKRTTEIYLLLSL